MDMERLHGEVRNEHYVLSCDDGTNIDVTRITNVLYLVNGVFFMIRPDLDMHNASDVVFYIHFMNEPLFHYRGAEKGHVVSFAYVPKFNSWTPCPRNLVYFSGTVQKAAMEAYDEYKKRAGI